MHQNLSFLGADHTMLGLHCANRIPYDEEMVQAKAPDNVTTLTIGLNGFTQRTT
jgi:hypothetical protein